MSRALALFSIPFFIGLFVLLVPVLIVLYVLRGAADREVGSGSRSSRRAGQGGGGRAGWSACPTTTTPQCEAWGAASPAPLSAEPLSIVLAFVAWIGQWAVLFTGSYPEGMHRFLSGIVRLNTRAMAYLYGLTNTYPGFSLDA